MRRMSQCLNTKLAGIVQTALVLQDLNTKIIDYLPHNLRGHLQSAVLTKDV